MYLLFVRKLECIKMVFCVPVHLFHRNPDYLFRCMTIMSRLINDIHLMLDYESDCLTIGVKQSLLFFGYDYMMLVKWISYIGIV